MRPDGAVAATLLPDIHDPIVRTGWGNTFGYTLMLQGRYEEARNAIVPALEDVDRFELEFARPHLLWTLAAVYLGLRKFALTDQTLHRVERAADEASNFHLHLQLNVRALRARLLLAQQRPLEAVGVVSEEFSSISTRAMYGEYLATRALALAVSGDVENATRVLQQASAKTHAVETQVLVAAVETLQFLGTPAASARVQALLEMASSLQCWDGIVCAFRASRPLLEEATRLPDRARLAEVLKRSNDRSLLNALRITLPIGRRGHELLSRRESEVLDLLTQGMTNRAIAKALFISDSTVKVHVRHIFGKLGARTRAEAVARALGQGHDRIG